MDAKCYYCGKYGTDMMPSFWNDRTRWFCGLDCLEKFKAVAIGGDYSEQVLDGEAGTAKSIFEYELNEKHAELVNHSGRMMYEARVKAYAWYCRECRAWGRDPEPEQLWFAHANAQCSRLLKSFKQNGGENDIR